MPRLDSMIDLSHHRAGSIGFQALKELGIAAVIHKATRARTMSTRLTRGAAGPQRPLVYSGGHMISAKKRRRAPRAASFPQTVGDAAGVFVCLDSETYFRKKDPMTPHTMSLADAHD